MTFHEEFGEDFSYYGSGGRKRIDSPHRSGELNGSNGQRQFVPKTQLDEQKDIAPNDKAAGCCQLCSDSWNEGGPSDDCATCPCHSPTSRTGKSWPVCEICQFELRPNAPFYGGHQKDCPRADSKVRCTYLYCHGASNGCVPDCSCKKNGHKPHILPDSEDDAIEGIIDSSEDNMPYLVGFYGFKDWLRNKWIEEAKEEGRREATLEFSRVSGGYEAGKRAALDELERRMSSISYSSIGAKMLFNSIKNHIEDMRK